MVYIVRCEYILVNMMYPDIYVLVHIGSIIATILVKIWIRGLYACTA